MKPLRLQIFFFTVLLLAAMAVLRLTLHTVPGLIALAGICAVRLLWFLYRSMCALVIALWGVSAGIAERIQESRENGVSRKEAPHAARLL